MIQASCRRTLILQPLSSSQKPRASSYHLYSNFRRLQHLIIDLYSNFHLPHLSINLYSNSPSAPDHRPSFQLPASAPDHRPLFQLPPSAPKSQQDGAQRLFNVPTASTLCNAVAAELNADNMAMVQDTNVGKEENLPPSPFRIPSPKLHAEAQLKLRYPPGLDPSTGEFTELLTELASNLSTPAGILRGHANSLRRSHHETSQRMAENLKTRAVLTNLVTHLQAVITLRRRSIFQEHFPRN